MRIILLLISVFLSFKVEAAPAPASGAPMCRAGILDAGRELLNGLNYTAGNVDACNTNPDGSYNISCDEVMQADANAFSAHYDYTHDANDSNFINCNPIIAPQILEDLQLQDMAKATADSLSCNLAFLNSYDTSPAIPEATRLNDEAQSAFDTIKEDLKKLIAQRDGAISQGNDYRTLCHREAGDGGILPMNCTTRQALDGEANRMATLGQTNMAIDALIATVPYGTEESVREVILAQAQSSSPASFLPAFKDAVKEVRTGLREFQSDLNDTSARVATDSGSRVTAYLRSDACNTPSIENKFFSSTQYNELIDSRAGLSPKLKSIMKCRRDARETGASRIQKGIMAASIASAVVTGGASLAGVAISGAARTALIVADLSLTAVDGVMVADQIYGSCYNNSTAIQRGGETCNPSQGLNMALIRTGNAECALNVVGAALPGIFIAGGAVVRRLSSRTAAGAEALAAEARAETRTAGEVTDDVASSGDEIIVTARETRAQRRARLARERAAARTEAESETAGARAGATPPERARTTAAETGAPRTRVTEVTSANADQVLRQSLNDKNRMDEILRSAGIDNIEEAHTAINQGIEEFIAAHPNLTAAQKAELRNLHGNLLEERRALTQHQTEADAAQLERTATSREVDCKVLNSLWGNPPFEPSAKCRRVEFSERNEKYCACGGAGKIGNWLLPCAETLEQYMISAEFQDVTATPAGKAFQACRRVSIPPGTTCLHGGLGPTMAGYGGAAQIICQNAEWTSSTRTAVGNGKTRQQILEEAGIRLSDNPPALEIKRIAIMHDDPGVTEILYKVRGCLQNHNDLCPPGEIARIRSEYNTYVTRNPRLTTTEQNDLVEQYFQYAEGRMVLNSDGVIVPPTARPAR